MLAVGACAAGGSSRDDRGRRRDQRLSRELAVADSDATADGMPSDIRAADTRPADARRDSRPPDTKPPPDTRPPDTKPPGPQTLVSFDFEGSGGGLTATKDWQWGVLAFSAGTSCDSTPTPPTACHSGTHCWGTVLNDCYSPLGNANNSCAAVNAQGASVLQLNVTIPAGYKNARLVYWDWNDFFKPYDWSEVRANGQVLFQDCTSYTAPSAWTKRTIVLDSYVGKAVSIAFHFYATTVVNYSGWYIDDLSIGEY